MGLLFDDQPDAIPRSNFASYTPAPAEEPEPSVLGAGFRLENDMIAVVNMLARDRFEPNPEFDFKGAAERSELFAMMPDAFVGVDSEAEWRWVEQKLGQELQDRRTIAAAGWSGIGAAMLGGVFSPTILLPAGSAATAGRVLTAAGRAAAWTAGGAAIQEGLLGADQLTRTKTEQAIGVGSAAVLGGILGGGIRYLDPLGLDRFGKSMADPTAQQAISRLDVGPSGAGGEDLFLDTLNNFQIRLGDEGRITEQLDSVEALLGRPYASEVRAKIEADVQALRERGLRGAALTSATRRILREAPHGKTPEGVSLSAAAAPPMEDVGRIFGQDSKIMDILLMRWLGPVVRQAGSRHSPIRHLMNQLSTGGMLREGNLRGLATAEGGDVESRVKQWYAGLVRSIQEERRLFREYYRETGKGGSFRAFFAQSEQEKFATQIREAMDLKLRGERHGDPFIASAADRYIQHGFMPLLREARELNIPGFAGFDDEFLLRRALQKVSQQSVIEEGSALREIVRQNVHRVLRSDPDLMVNPKIRRILGLDDPAYTVDRILQEREFAEAVSEKVVGRWEGVFNKHGTIDAMAEVPDMAKFAYIDPTVPFEVNGRTRFFSEFLEDNAEKILRSFVRSMGGNVELYRTFGTVNPSAREGMQFPMWSQLQDYFAQQRRLIDEAADMDDAAKKKAQARLAADLNAFERDFDVVVGRIRHTWGQPADPSNVWHRAGRQALNLNTLRLMGSVVLSSVADLARSVMKYGMMTTFRDGLMPLMADFKNFKMSALEAKYAGTALDIVLHGRSHALFDLFDDAEYGTAIERGMQTMTNNIGIVAGFDYWNVGLKMFNANLAAAKLMRDIKSSVEGSATKAQKAFLGSHGISPELAQRIWRQTTELGGGVEVRPGVWMPNVEDWNKIDGEEIYDWDALGYKEWVGDQQVREESAGRDLQRAWRAAIARAVDDTIITPGVERANWLDSSTTGRIIGQFRSFAFSSTHKTLAAAVQDARVGNMAPILSGAAFSVALGMLSYYTWAISVGGDAKERMLNELDAAINGDEEALGRWVDEGINRSGLLGVFAEVQKLGERIPATQPYVTFGDAPTARSPFVQPTLEAMGPSVSLLNNLGRVVMTGDDPTTETFRKAKQLLPFQNVFYMRQGLDAINEAIMRNVGLNPG